MQVMDVGKAAESGSAKADVSTDMRVPLHSKGAGK